jgi:hypothetical protein
VSIADGLLLDAREASPALVALAVVLVADALLGGTLLIVVRAESSARAPASASSRSSTGRSARHAMPRASSRSSWRSGSS